MEHSLRSQPITSSHELEPFTIFALRFLFSYVKQNVTGLVEVAALDLTPPPFLSQLFPPGVQSSDTISYYQTPKCRAHNPGPCGKI
jgi:hypothetical protein